MIIQCAWCKEVLGMKEPMESREISHGICKKCLIEAFSPEIASRTNDALPGGVKEA